MIQPSPDQNVMRGRAERRLKMNKIMKLSFIKGDMRITFEKKENEETNKGQVKKRKKMLSQRGKTRWRWKY